ncbi:hypothetical protein [Spartinivicinus ruber]|uniref:hypothetical protein n=1 Tax=Spartinivicinus ruber TaxID=2683272 RepID=UPI0013D1B887|nr:hypothetical protein [Spartinivicinus ruber]
MKVVAIIIGILLLITICLIGIGYYFWSNYGEQFIADTQQVINEANTFATNSNSSDCLNKVDEMMSNCKEIKCTLHNRFFLSECLVVAKYEATFCHDIPSETDFINAAKWKKQYCSKILKDDAYCEGVIEEVVIFCDSKRDLL